ncbi:uncharacterized protein MONBRDRAFT_33857 [Monosiga brevicollis MX1]|uniref:HSF-type DNA-binding domain-containing protein n=1 Tax=Monosiga brevicollis TaxID=81824 RepID=A9V7Y3_MONBE|nr:uncharacterized protein MONBRDRAFT_33857 [Monosiga brevicollis MX1]EDQ86384.1 predicted protein [Monosiga brevicollis MX1]|eukprot:XP_001748774.1 hypothetical protein [Monosiga brevicollis MX1]
MAVPTSVAMGDDGLMTASSPRDRSESTDGKDNKGVPAFVSKLLTMINDPSTDHLISWTPAGETFKVHNATTLAREVLPRYYKHGNFTSLVRQLNMYGFHKVVGVDTGLRSNDQEWEFVHPCVQRDRPELLVHIKRKDSTSNTKRKVSREDMESVMQNLETMRGNQDEMSHQFHDMQRQNQALWQEVTVLRQRHEQQRVMIGRIMHFLTRLVRNQPAMTGSGRPGAKRPKHLALEGGMSLPGIEELPIISDTDLELQTPTAPTSTTTVPTSSVPYVTMPSPSSSAGALGMDKMQGVSDLIEPELTHFDTSLNSSRQRLQDGGLDDHMLQSLWAAANHPTSVGANVPATSSWETNPNQIHYEALSDLPDIEQLGTPPEDDTFGANDPDPLLDLLSPNGSGLDLSRIPTSSQASV